MFIAKEFSKTGKARQVPIHPHLIEMGFLEYVRSRKGKPLFYDPDLAKDATGPSKQSHKAAQRVADWVRQTFGIIDSELLPWVMLEGVSMLPRYDIEGS